MNKSFLILIATVIFSIIVLISSCNKDNPDPPKTDNANDLQKLTTITADARSKFLEIAPLVNGDPKLALIQTLDWAKQQEGVSNAFLQDSVYLFVELSSGLTSLFWFDEVTSDGSSKFRGSGAAEFTAFPPTNDCTNIVDNKNVLIYSPGEEQFTYDYKSKVPEKLQASSLVKKIDYLKNEEANIAAISSFSNYGLVLMETHGTAISFMTGNTFSFMQSEIPTNFDEFRNELSSQIGEQYFEYLMNGKLMVGGKVDYDPLQEDWWSDNQADFESGTFNLWVSAKFLEDGPNLSNTIVIGNFCYSGWTTIVEDYPEPIGKAILNLNPRTYYAYQRPNGYSRTVDNLESIAIEDSIITGLIYDNDSTGIAHLKADESTFQTTWSDLYMIQLGMPNWCYEGCGEEFIDIRDGSKYQTVCIGDQIWMAENLRYLPIVHSSTQFEEAGDNSQPGYGVYGYDGNNVTVAKEEQNYSTYGVLYNWMAAMAGQASTNTNPSSVQGICPDGWHLPSKAEWNELINFLGGSNPAGGKLKEAGTSHWNSPNTGATNETGFTGLPGGYYHYNGFFNFINEVGFFWSTSDTISGSGLLGRPNILKYNDNISFIGAAAKENGYSCRCVKDD